MTMPTQNQTQPISPRAKLEQAIALAKTGHKAEAGQMLREIVALQPVNQAAWLWLSAVTASKAEAESALAQARHIDPAHPSLPQAEQWLAHRFSAAPATKRSRVVKSPAAPDPLAGKSKNKGSKSWFGAFNSLALGVVMLALLLGGGVLLLGVVLEVNAATRPTAQTAAPELAGAETDALAVEPDVLARLESARQSRDWAAAIALLEALHEQHPQAEQFAAQLADAYRQRGITLRSRGYVEEALTNFEQALELAPDHAPTQTEARLASAYLAGTTAYQAGQWLEAVTHFELIRQENSDYPHLRDLLYSAYYNHALARQAAGELAAAKQALELAINLRPDLSAPRRQMAEIEFALAPNTPLSAPIGALQDRIIVVGLAEQRMEVYEGNRKVFDFVVSTGEPGRETAVGDFEIQNKIDVAYASTWNLDMPYWMGIYWAGPLQNGIHALPIVKHTGYKLWDGYLGQRVSYGCVILSDEDAAALYNWTEIGTKVKIVPSLANWSPRHED